MVEILLFLVTGWFLSSIIITTTVSAVNYEKLEGLSFVSKGVKIGRFMAGFFLLPLVYFCFVLRRFYIIGAVLFGFFIGLFQPKKSFDIVQEMMQSE